MPEVSAAIVVLAGALLILAGLLPSPVTEATRQRVVGFGYLLTSGGLLAWAVAFGITLVRAAKSL